MACDRRLTTPRSEVAGDIKELRSSHKGKAPRSPKENELTEGLFPNFKKSKMKKAYPLLVLLGFLGASMLLNNVAEHSSPATMIHDTSEVINWDTLLVLDAETGRENIHIISAGLGKVTQLK